MLKIYSSDVESELNAYCQKCLKFLSVGDFEKACGLISAPNTYGARWCREEISEAVADYFNKSSEFQVQNVDITNCSPEFMVCDDGSFLFAFYLPVNGEITDLTVEFEFNQIKHKEYSATINDIHVL